MNLLELRSILISNVEIQFNIKQFNMVMTQLNSKDLRELLLIIEELIQEEMEATFLMKLQNLQTNTRSTKTLLLI